MNPFESQLILTQNETAFYSTFYTQLNPNSGEIEPSKLADLLSSFISDRSKLKEIWDVAQLSKSKLDKNDLFTALKLVAAAQGGLPITKDSLSRPTLLPVKELKETISAEEITKFSSFFDAAGPSEGYLSGRVFA
jgi:hypothetical protein